jgi:hypothetical protein
MGRLTTAEAAHIAPPPTAEEEEYDEPEQGKLRRCAVTRERLPKERMLRFVAMPPPDGSGAARIVPDLAATLPGRGIWLSARGDVIETARTRGAFARAARCQVVVSPDLTSELEAALVRRVGETLGLARRAGQAVFGFSKAREWLSGGKAGVVVQASDGSPEERQRFLGGHAGHIPAVAPLNGAQLGRVFGREHVVHVVVQPGRLAERVAQESERLAGVQAAPAATAAGPARIQPGGDGHLGTAAGSPPDRLARPAVPDGCEARDTGG